VQTVLQQAEVLAPLWVQGITQMQIYKSWTQRNQNWDNHEH
jgi:hypothetical protein